MSSMCNMRSILLLPNCIPCDIRSAVPQSDMKGTEKLLYCTDTVGCNYLSLPSILTRGTTFLIYIISQEICTRFCCALLCCSYVIIHNEFKWSIYPYWSRLLCWHWGNRQISQCITTTKHSKAKTVCVFLGIYCIPLCHNGNRPYLHMHMLLLFPRASAYRNDHVRATPALPFHDCNI